jgi:hypothetical protein
MVANLPSVFHMTQYRAEGDHLLRDARKFNSGKQTINIPDVLSTCFLPTLIDKLSIPSLISHQKRRRERKRKYTEIVDRRTEKTLEAKETDFYRRAIAGISSTSIS